MARNRQDSVRPVRTGGQSRMEGLVRAISEDEEARRELVNALMKRPLDYPDEFRGWLPRYLETNPPRLSRSQLPSVLPSNIRDTDPAAAATNVLKWNGTNWVNGVVNPSELAQEGATTGDLMRWDGADWAAHTINSVKVHNSVAITHTTSGAYEFLTFNSEDHDNASMHSTVSLTGRLVAQKTGVFHVYGAISWASSATGQRAIQIRMNGATTIAAHLHDAAAGSQRTHMTISAQVKVATASEYAELGVFQNTGGNLDIDRLADLSPYFGMTWIADG